MKLLPKSYEMKSYEIIAQEKWLGKQPGKQ